MSQTSWPSPGHNARAVTDAEYSHLALQNADGVFPDASDLVFANGNGLQVFVRANRYAIVQGHAWTSGTVELALPVAPNNDGAARVDTAVLRLDRSTWDVTAAIRQGAPGSAAPTLVRDPGDAGLFEIPLADITVDAGAASIAADKVRTRTLLQSGAVRPCRTITDIQDVLAAGDLVFETSTGAWIGWSGTGGDLLFTDTGDIPLPEGFNTWTVVGPMIGNRVGNIASLNINLQRAGVPFKTDDADGSQLTGPIDTRLRPKRDEYFAVRFTGTGGVARVEIRTNGEVWVLHPTNDVDVGRFLRFTATYLV